MYSPDTWDQLPRCGVGAHGCDDTQHGCESVDAFCVRVHGVIKG